jgi:hypothetical protein
MSMPFKEVSGLSAPISSVSESATSKYQVDSVRFTNNSIMTHVHPMRHVADHMASASNDDARAGLLCVASTIVLKTLTLARLYLAPGLRSLVLRNV